MSRVCFGFAQIGWLSLLGLLGACSSADFGPSADQLAASNPHNFEETNLRGAIQLTGNGLFALKAGIIYSIQKSRMVLDDESWKALLKEDGTPLTNVRKFKDDVRGICALVNYELWCQARMDRLFGIRFFTHAFTQLRNDVLDFAYTGNSICVLTLNREIECMGKNLHFALGTDEVGSRSLEFVKPLLPEGHQAIAIYGNGKSYCTISRQEGNVHCWGFNPLPPLFSGEGHIHNGILPTLLTDKNGVPYTQVRRLDFGQNGIYLILETQGEVQTHCFGSNQLGRCGAINDDKYSYGQRIPLTGYKDILHFFHTTLYVVGSDLYIMGRVDSSLENHPDVQPGHRSFYTEVPILYREGVLQAFRFGPNLNAVCFKTLEQEWRCGLNSEERLSEKTGKLGGRQRMGEDGHKIDEPDVEPLNLVRRVQFFLEKLSAL